jgi:hypothetical protein
VNAHARCNIQAQEHIKLCSHRNKSAPAPTMPNRRGNIGVDMVDCADGYTQTPVLAPDHFPCICTLLFISMVLCQGAAQ